MICYLTLILISLKASSNCGKDFFVKWGKKSFDFDVEGENQCNKNDI